MTVLWQRRNRIRFGRKELEFVLDVAIDQKKVDFPIYRNQFLQLNGYDASPVPSDNLDALPLEIHTRVHDIITHTKIIAVGAFGRVSAGVQASTGVPVAVKVASSKSNRQLIAVRNEIEIAKDLSPHHNIVSFIATWCRHGNSPPCFTSNFDDYSMVMPLAQYSFEQFFKDRPSKDIRLQLFHDITKGLAHIHSLGIMHRDISPKNLLVYSSSADTGKSANTGEFV
ncbi:kinase-like domain-containing protein [Xylaria longipes]|nr:kinase-like domain-containing protein [Xylaria longipes]